MSIKVNPPKPLAPIDPQSPRPAIVFPDGYRRCRWVGNDPIYCAYHDDEWGIPERNSQNLFEKLILDGFQAGLSWITILRKREAFRAAFNRFDPEAICRYDSEKVESLMNNATIVRNRSKIEACITSAKAFLELEENLGFSNYLWDFVDGEPLQNSWRDQSEVPASTPLAEKIAKDLKSKGFRYCGPTIVYAFCQAVGMVNDHLVECHCHSRCAESASHK